MSQNNSQLTDSNSAKVTKLQMENVLDFFSQNAGPLILGVCAIIAAYINSNRSEYRLKRKKNRLKAKLQNICPHVQIEHLNGEFRISSLCYIFRRPWYLCIQCNSRLHEEQERKIVEQWSISTMGEDNRLITEKSEEAKLLKQQLDALGYD